MLKSKKHNIGFIQSGYVYAYDLKDKSLLWVKEFKSLWGNSTQIKMQLDEAKRRLLFNFKDNLKENCLLEIDFNGNIIQDTKSKSTYRRVVQDFEHENFSITQEVIRIGEDVIKSLKNEDSGIYRKYKSKRRLEDLALLYYRIQGFEGFHFDGPIGWKIREVLDYHSMTTEISRRFECFGIEKVDLEAVEALKVLGKCLRHEKRNYFRKILKIKHGMPDLFIYKKDFSDFFFVEVKGTNDHLSALQKLFLSYLMKNAVAKVKVVYLILPGEELVTQKQIEWNLYEVIKSLEAKDQKQLEELDVLEKKELT